MLLYSESAKVNDSYAETCMKLGDMDLALENYKKALILNPKNSNAEKMIAGLLEKKGV